jgi:hypothetical protein
MAIFITAFIFGIRFAGVFYDVESGLFRKGRAKLDKMFKKVEKAK